MASPAGGGAAGADTTYTLTASEPGVIHLDTLCLGIGSATGINAPGADYVRTGVVTSILAYNSIEMIRGRGDVIAPSGAFSAYRGINAIRLGDYKMQAGDTIAVTYQDDGTNTAAYVGSWAAAFTPAMSRGGVPEPLGRSLYSASTVLDLAAGAAGNCTMTFDEDGIFSLSSLQSRVLLDLASAAAAGTGQWIDGSTICDITGITLPSRNNMLIGQNTPVAPASMFSAGYRSYSFESGETGFGAIPVSAGDTIVIGYDLNNTDVGASVSFGGRFYPAAGVPSGTSC
tara:strand:+ start:165 stop:1022 length:858 start_codon:yes stop_codon:yes gene_type:complete